MGDELMNEHDERERDDNTGSHAVGAAMQDGAPMHLPRWASRAVIATASVVFLGGVGFIGYELTHEPVDNTPATISNTPTDAVTSDDSPTTEPSSQPSVVSSPAVDVKRVATRLTECVNDATKPEDVSVLANDCFFSYREHLADVYGMRDVGEVKISDLNVEDDSQAKVSAKVDHDGHQLGTITAYWVQNGEQFKVVDSSLTDYGRAYVRDDILKQVEVQR